MVSSGRSYEQFRLSRVSTPVVGLVPSAMLHRYVLTSFRKTTSVQSEFCKPEQYGQQHVLVTPINCAECNCDRVHETTSALRVCYAPLC
jgi:hypothetical protein